MKNKFKEEDLKEDVEIENGEFICSYFAWTSLSKQKEIVNRLEKITKESD